MERGSSSSNFFSSLNHDSNVNNPIDHEENVDSVNASGHSNHSSSSFIGSSDNPIDLEEHNIERGWLLSVPPNLPLLEQFIPDPQRARLVHYALQIRQWAHGATLQHQDGMVVGPMFNEPDVHEDMHLNVDNTSYEELLALEEHIGDVNTGLSEEAVLGCIKQDKYQSMKLGLLVEEELCCVCREEYVDGEELGKLDCGHEFHFNCIKQWLMQKNSCPICIKAALAI